MVKRNSQSNSKVRKVTIMKTFSMTLLMLVVLCETGQSAPRASIEQLQGMSRPATSLHEELCSGPTCKYRVPDVHEVMREEIAGAKTKHSNFFCHKTTERVLVSRASTRQSIMRAILIDIPKVY